MLKRVSCVLCLCAALATSPIVLGAPLAPNDGSIEQNLRLWLRMPDVYFDPTVGVWTDVSGKGHDAKTVGLVAAWNITFVAPTLSSGENPLVFSHPFSAVKSAGLADDLLRAGTLNGGAGMSQLTMLMVYKLSNRSESGAGAGRPAGIGSMAGEGVNLNNNFQPASDMTIRKDNGSVGGATVAHPDNVFFLRVARMNTAGIQQWINTDGTLKQVQNSNGTAFTTSTDTFYLGDLRAGNTTVSTVWSRSDLEIAEVLVYNAALTDAQIAGLCEWLQRYVGVAVRAAATGGNPASGATDILRDTTLSWKPVPSAVQRDVYFGTSFNDVNTASRTDPRGVLVSQGQTATTYNPGRLAFSTTYYWRIDEVNAPPDSTVLKGAVWSFTTEPGAYPVDGKSITAIASSAVDGQGPENTINGSGLANDRHGNDLATMWLTATGATGPAWIQYAFAQPIKLHEMWVWNHNGVLEPMLGFGVKDVTVEYSTDGATFQAVGTAQQFARATGQPDYTHNTVVVLGDVTAKYIKLTISSNWGGILPQYGLSEVRFFAVPTAAREPSPKSGAADLAPAVTLSWRAGREAGSHQVFLGTDPNNLTVTATVPKSSYDADLNLGQTYYWKIAEVNQAQDPTTWTSDVWSFSTLPYLVVEDFESYTDEDGKAVWQTWIDGYGIATNGSQVGNANPPYAERTMIHGGKQAMPLFYDNTSGATYSEAKRTFASPQNWAAHGIKSLTFYFLGQAANTGQLYVKINSTRVNYSGAAADLARIDWQPCVIDLSKVTSGLQSVTSLTIGVDGAGSKGTLYVDDIRLYPTAAELITPKDPGSANLVGYWNFDAGAGTVAVDSSGKGRNGTITGATWDTGKLGGALRFNGTSNYVEIPAAAFSTISQQATVSVWLYVDPTVTQTPFTFAAFRDPAVGNTRVFSSHVVYNGNLIFDSGGDTSGYDRISKTPAAYEYGNAWTHWTFVKNAQTGEQKVYRNGLLWNSGTGMTRTMTGVTVFTLGVHPNKTANFWTGVMDDFRLYDRALSPEEILYLAGKTAPVFKTP